MKKLPLLALSALLLVACGNNDEHKKKDNKPKTEQKHKDKKQDKKKDTAKKKETEKKKTESKSSNEQSQQPQQENNQQQAQAKQNQQQQSQQVQQPQQQQAQSGNAEACVLNSQQCDGLTEMQIIDAYKGLVSRGVLPQSDGTGNIGQAIKESKQMQQGVSQDEIVRQRYQSWVDAGIWTQEEMNQTMADYNANQ